MKAKMIFLFLVFFSLTIQSFAQNANLKSGPMLGYSEMREVMVWLQTTNKGKIQLNYWDLNRPNQIFKSEIVETDAETAFTAKIILSLLEPGKKYGYQVLLNEKPLLFPYPLEFQTQSLWQWRTDPPSFSIALGSCAYINDTPYDRPGKPYGSDYHIFESILAKKPDAMLWLGDNTYLREADWNSRSGILYRYSHTRSTPELQGLLGSVHHYAIWDDHDFGPNDSDRSFYLKEYTLEAFRLFWGNPTSGLPEQSGITSQFQWADIDFFLLDNRFYRAPDERKTGERTQFGKIQLEWLIDAMKASLAPFKMVATGGQFLTTADISENHIHLYPEERAYLIKRIEEEEIKNVIFLTGDRHFTELTEMKLANGNFLYDLTVSPLTSGVNTNPDLKPNILRVPGTAVTEHNFGLLTFSGKSQERKLTIKIFDSMGKEKWMKEILSE
ncbi:MAG: alkaline phosphatase family protein [Bacteroidetes bacterium]|nr:alkaline phosphatase family protein [Bacteroidota bacterium]